MATYSVGDRVVAACRIIDDSPIPRFAGLLADAGDVLVVTRVIRPGSVRPWVAYVRHVNGTDGAFGVLESDIRHEHGG